MDSSHLKKIFIRITSVAAICSVSENIQKVDTGAIYSYVGKRNNVTLERSVRNFSILHPGGPSVDNSVAKHILAIFE